MKLKIPYDMGKDFIDYIIDMMQDYMKDNLQVERLQQAQNYVDAVKIFKSIYISKIDLASICYASTENIVIRYYESRYELTFDENSKIYGTNIYYKDLINLINYGNLFVKPYPIFTDMFKFFEDHLDRIHDYYLKTVR